MIGIMFLIMILMIFAGVPVAFSILGSGIFFLLETADSGLSESRNGAGFISSAGCSPVCVCRGFDGSRRNIQTDD